MIFQFDRCRVNNMVELLIALRAIGIDHLKGNSRVEFWNIEINYIDGNFCITDHGIIYKSNTIDLDFVKNIVKIDGHEVKYA